MRSLVLLGLLTIFAPRAMAAPTWRTCTAGDPLPPGVVASSTTTTGAYVVADASGYHAIVDWSASGTAGPNYYLYRGNGTSYIASSTSTASSKRCVVFDDPAGELSSLLFLAPTTNNTITVADPNTNATLVPIRAAGLHLFAFGRRGNDTIVTGDTTESSLWAYLIGGSGTDSITSRAGMTCAMGSSRAGVSPGGELPDYTTAFASERDRFEAECVPAASPSVFPDGDDTITIDGDESWAWGGEGSDTLYGGDGPDQLHGELSGGAGSTLGVDTIYGGGGEDWIRSGNGGDWMYGDDGNDVIYADKGDDHVWGGADNDVIFGGDGTDELYGDGGDDEIVGGDGDDLMEGNDEDDTLCGDENDSYEGGGGVDTLFHALALGLNGLGEPYASEEPAWSDAGPEAGQSCSAFQHDQAGLGVYDFGAYPAVGADPAGVCDLVLSYDPADQLLNCPDPTAYALP